MAKKSKQFKKTINKLKEAQIQSAEQNLLGYTAAEKKVYDTLEKAVEALPAEQVVQGDVPIPEMVKIETQGKESKSLVKTVEQLESELEEVIEKIKEIEKKFFGRYRAGQELYISQANPIHKASIVIDNNDYLNPAIIDKKNLLSH